MKHILNLSNQGWQLEWRCSCLSTNFLQSVRDFDATIELDLSMSVMNVGVLQLTTSNRISRIVSMYYNNASVRPKPTEDIQDNVPSELVTCSTSAIVHLSAIHQTTSSDHPIARVHWRHAKIVRPAYLPCRLRLTRRGNRQRYPGRRTLVCESAMKR
jgi:hypothetical protein